MLNFKMKGELKTTTILCTNHKRRTFRIVQLTRISTQPKNLPTKEKKKYEEEVRNTPLEFGLQCMDCLQAVKTGLTKGQANSAKKLYAEELKAHKCTRV